METTYTIILISARNSPYPDIAGTWSVPFTSYSLTSGGSPVSGATVTGDQPQISFFIPNPHIALPPTWSPVTESVTVTLPDGYTGPRPDGVSVQYLALRAPVAHRLANVASYTRRDPMPARTYPVRAMQAARPRDLAQRLLPATLSPAKHPQDKFDAMKAQKC
jgi:hypothetical protein